MANTLKSLKDYFIMEEYPDGSYKDEYIISSNNILGAINQIEDRDRIPFIVKIFQIKED